MAGAEVGDDVFGEDPTVRRLEARIAEVLGKEAALFVPSGTMGNQLGIRVHCQAGDEFLCESNCHVFVYEQAAYAQLFGIAVQPIDGDHGVLHVEQLINRIRPLNNDHAARTRLVCLENTHNRGAGRVQPYDTVVEICGWAADNGLARHLDGARLFNAVVATGIPAADWASHFDTVSVCFSKGLGAPVGSALVGPGDKIRQARRHRKALGGGMRQAGVIAAGALYALENNIERLAEDHQNARILAEAVRRTPGLRLDPENVDTNIVIFELDPELGTAAAFSARLRDEGVLMNAMGPQRLRAVTHLDVSRECVQQAAAILQETTAAVSSLVS
jgi:threonine aldolase